MNDFLPVDEALARLLEHAAPLPAEIVEIAAAGGRILAEDIHALRTQPPFDASAMDGYAVRGSDVTSLPARLRIIGDSLAGKRFDGAVGDGQAIRIFTGAPVPQGADTIVLQEDTCRAGEDTVEILEAPVPGRYIRRAGLDFHEGELLLSAGRELDPAALSLAAAANHALVSVIRRPLVAILATGTELVAPGTQPGPDEIVASNSHGIALLAREAGADVLDLGIARDDRAEIAAAVSGALDAGADIVVTLGGASVGDHDLVREVLAGLGMTLGFWKIRMRPGKPLMFGRFGSRRVLGLPGNPVSSLVCSHLFLRPLVARLAGRQWQEELVEGILATPMNQNDQRQDYVRAKVIRQGRQLVARPFDLQDSSMLKTLAEANALIVREPNAPAAAAGDPCRLIMLRRS